MRHIRNLRRFAPGVVIPVLALAGAGEASAGGFGLREQSSYYQGTSFAGVAAGGWGLASMYWNPAAISFVPGLQVEGNVSYVAPHASIDVNRATAPITGTNLGTFGVSDIVDNAAIPAMYASYAWERWAVGVSVNAPFGLVTDAPCNWSGRFYGCYSRIYDVNVQGNVAYKVNDWLVIGGGVSVNYMDARLNQAQINGVTAAGPVLGTGRWMATTSGSASASARCSRWPPAPRSASAIAPPSTSISRVRSRFTRRPARIWRCFRPMPA